MQIDEFESQFISSFKEAYKYQDISLSGAVLITDCTGEAAQALLSVVHYFLNFISVSSNDSLEISSSPELTLIDGAQFDSVEALLGLIEKSKPDLIVVQRNLKSGGRRLVYGLSTYIDALTQVCSSPVLLLPDLDPNDSLAFDSSLRNLAEVMIETDHLTGDSSLINWGVRFTPFDGHLLLAHLENQKIFDYYMEVIRRVPEINSDLAEETITEKLKQLPADFIESTKAVLRNEVPELRVKGIVSLGQGIEHYAQLIEENGVDLLVLNTKVEGQLAMGGFSYVLAVELKHIPLLLI